MTGDIVNKGLKYLDAQLKQAGSIRAQPSLYGGEKQADHYGRVIEERCEGVRNFLNDTILLAGYEGFYVKYGDDGRTGLYPCNLFVEMDISDVEKLEIPELYSRYKCQYERLYKNNDRVILRDLFGNRMAPIEVASTFDRLLEEHPDVVQAFAEYRGDAISSDREAIAFMLALGKFSAELAAPEPEQAPATAKPIPIGRIDFFGANGKVGESVEYTDEKEFLKDVEKENNYGAPMSITLYRNAEGKTISRDFLKDLNPIRSLSIEDYKDPTLEITEENVPEQEPEEEPEL